MLQNETCLTCEIDCGACSLEARVGGAIIAVVFLVVLGAAATGLVSISIMGSEVMMWTDN